MYNALCIVCIQIKKVFVILVCLYVVNQFAVMLLWLLASASASVADLVVVANAIHDINLRFILHLCCLFSVRQMLHKYYTDKQYLMLSPNCPELLQPPSTTLQNVLR